MSVLLLKLLTGNPYGLAIIGGVWLLSIVASNAATGWGVWTIVDNAWKADQVTQERALRERYAEDVKAANARADEAERKVEAIRAGTRVVTRYVDREVLSPIYSTECLPPRGVQLVNSALTGAPADPGQPDPALPDPHPAGGRVGSGGPP